jgi:REP element-mobilizing transposase RayT
MPHGPGYNSLRYGRYSAPGAEYFLTLTLLRPATGLSDVSLVDDVRAEWQSLEESKLWRVRTAVIMPDHLHLLVILGESSELSALVRSFKGRLTPRLREHGLRWQAGYYDHRVRPDDDRLALFRYIYLNPYRDGLLGTCERWPGYDCCGDDWAWFEPLTNQATPFPEWLR